MAGTAGRGKTASCSIKWQQPPPAAPRIQCGGPSRSLPRPDGEPDWLPSIITLRDPRDRPEAPIPARLALARSVAGIRSLSTPQHPEGCIQHRDGTAIWDPRGAKEAWLCQGGVAARLHHMSRTMPKKCSSSSSNSRGGPVGGGEIRERLAPHPSGSHHGLTEAHPMRVDPALDSENHG